MTELMRVVVPHVLARAEPSGDAVAVTDCLFGERMTKIDARNGYFHVRNEYDKYEGWAPAAAFSPDRTTGEPSMRVLRRLARAYHAPDGEIAYEDIGMGSPIFPVERVGAWIKDAGGLWFAAAELTESPYMGDPVERALRFLGVPYVWGGRHGSGLDCSALVQICAMLAGQSCPRDTKDQTVEYGELIEGGLHAAARQRGDLLFMPGHVAILTGAYEAVHADGRAGLVHIQELSMITEERGFRGDDVTIRRPPR